MESLAAVLRRIPLFATLPPGSLAKIIADLREEHYPCGAVICHEGDAASDFYIVKSGEIEVSISRRGNVREVVAIRGAWEWFGERALFADGRRGATVAARTDLELWRLTKEKFDDLMEENPWLILHFAQELSERLDATNTELADFQAAFSAQVTFVLRAYSEQQQEFLARTAILSSLEPKIVEALTGHSDGAALLDKLAASSAFIRRRDGVLCYHPAVRSMLLDHLLSFCDADALRALHGCAARAYHDAGQWQAAIDHFLDAEDFSTAARLISAQQDESLAAGDLDGLRKRLARFPHAMLAYDLAPLQTRLERALHPQAEDLPVAGRGSLARRLFSTAGRRWLGAVLGLAVGLGIAFAPPLVGLNGTSMHMFALLAWAVVFWVFDVLPDYVVGIGLILGWILFAIVPPEIAVSGFTTSPFFLIIGVLGMTASLQRSGLLFRLALYILRSFPLTYRGQALGLALGGTGITTSIPDTTSGTAIAGPIILALSDSLGYARRSRGSAGLAMAALLGFGQMSPFFLTGAAENLLAWGLLPEAARAQISWGTWLLAALPLAVTTFALGFAATMWYFPPEFQPTVSRGLVETQIEALGPPSRAEIINALVVLCSMVGWITAPYHHIDVAWVAMTGLVVLLALNLLDRMTFRAGINWDFLFYLGAVLSLTSVVRELRVDDWVIHRLMPIVEPLTASPIRFLLVTTLAVFAARFILPSFPLVSLLTLTIVPIAATAGIYPLALLLVICTSVTVWFLPYQSTCYLALYFGTKEKAFSHQQVRALAWTYGVIYLVAVLVAIPYWRFLKLLP